MAKKPTTEIVPFQVGQLVTAAAQLEVTLKVDANLLRQEVEQFTNGFATVQLGIKTILVQDEESYQQCIDLREDSGRRVKGLTAIWERYKTPLNAARAVVLKFEHDTVDACQAAKDLASQKAEKFLDDRKLQKKQADERLARSAAKTQGELLGEAEELAMMGRMDEAENLKLQAQMVVAPQLPDAVPQATGAKVGTKFTATVTDIIAFARAVVEGRIDLVQQVKPGDERPILVIDQVVLNAVVARQMTGLNWPGIDVREGSKISSAGGR